MTAASPTLTLKAAAPRTGPPATSINALKNVVKVLSRLHGIRCQQMALNGSCCQSNIRGESRSCWFKVLNHLALQNTAIRIPVRHKIIPLVELPSTNAQESYH